MAGPMLMNPNGASRRSWWCGPGAGHLAQPSVPPCYTQLKVASCPTWPRRAVRPGSCVFVPALVGEKRGVDIGKVAQGNIALSHLQRDPPPRASSQPPVATESATEGLPLVSRIADQARWVEVQIVWCGAGPFHAATASSQRAREPISAGSAENATSASARCRTPGDHRRLAPPPASQSFASFDKLKCRESERPMYKIARYLDESRGDQPGLGPVLTVLEPCYDARSLIFGVVIGPVLGPSARIRRLRAGAGSGVAVPWPNPRCRHNYSTPNRQQYKTSRRLLIGCRGDQRYQIGTLEPDAGQQMRLPLPF